MGGKDASWIIGDWKGSRVGTKVAREAVEGGVSEEVAGSWVSEGRRE